MVFGLMGCGEGATPIYGVCESPADCGGAATACEFFSARNSEGTTTRAHVCSTLCNEDRDCPEPRRATGGGAYCLDINGYDYSCYSGCVSDDECEPGLVCDFVPVASGIELLLCVEPPS